MSVKNSKRADELSRLAWKCLVVGEKLQAARLAKEAACLDPALEDPWLILASLSQPKESLEHLIKVLEINPSSRRARAGIHWSVQRLRRSELHSLAAEDIVPLLQANYSMSSHFGSNLSEPPLLRASKPLKRAFLALPWLVGIIILCVSIFFWFGAPADEALAAHNAPIQESTPPAGASITSHPPASPTIQFVPATSTQPFTPTRTRTPTPTFTSTSTLFPSLTHMPTITRSPVVTKTPTYSPAQMAAATEQELRANRWVDVDVRSQRASAYQGDKVVKEFVVSTGTAYFPTVIGQFHIYRKYQYSDMYGPGYYLPSVPFVMYFYEGYALHGVYWHHKFGTPWSRGCVNFTVEDAQWLFDFTSMGTLVNVH